MKKLTLMLMAAGAFAKKELLIGKSSLYNYSIVFVLHVV